MRCIYNFNSRCHNTNERNKDGVHDWRRAHIFNREFMIESRTLTAHWSSIVRLMYPQSLLPINRRLTTSLCMHAVRPENMADHDIKMPIDAYRFTCFRWVWLFFVRKWNVNWAPIHGCITCLVKILCSANSKSITRMFSFSPVQSVLKSIW